MAPTCACPEQRILWQRYLTALRIYRHMIPVLDAVSTRDEFEEAYERAEGVRVAFVGTRFELRDHIERHGCAAIPAEEAGAS